MWRHGTKMFGTPVQAGDVLAVLERLTVDQQLEEAKEALVEAQAKASVA
jgi:multidrug resistance efflux pump